MVTIDQSDGFRIVISERSCARTCAHHQQRRRSHVLSLRPKWAPELVWAFGMKRASVRKAMRIIKANSAAYLEEWRKVHG